jgi:hypothetical protein
MRQIVDPFKNIKGKCFIALMPGTNIAISSEKDIWR